MQPHEILADTADTINKNGMAIRKGTIAAFTENIRVLESLSQADQAYDVALADLLQLIPSLQQLQFFNFYSIKSAKVREILKTNYPNLSYFE